MFERFTERARQVVLAAQQEARDLNAHGIGTEHLLLGLIAEKEGLAADVLTENQVTSESVRVRIPGVFPEISIDPQPEPGRELPFSDPAKRALELALREALSLGHNYIGTEHVLLSLLGRSSETGDVNRGTNAAVLLKAFGLDLDRIRGEIVRRLTVIQQRVQEQRRGNPRVTAGAMENLSRVLETMREVARDSPESDTLDARLRTLGGQTAALVRLASAMQNMWRELAESVANEAAQPSSTSREVELTCIQCGKKMMVAVGENIGHNYVTAWCFHYQQNESGVSEGPGWFPMVAPPDTWKPFEPDQQGG